MVHKYGMVHKERIPLLMIANINQIIKDLKRLYLNHNQKPLEKLRMN